MRIVDDSIYCSVAPAGRGDCLRRMDLSPWAFWKMWFHERFFCEARLTKRFFEREDQRKKEEASRKIRRELGIRTSQAGSGGQG
jgi:hypothetical protein